MRFKKIFLAPIHNLRMSDEFARCAKEIETYVQYLSNEHKANLYGLYKQALFGDAPQAPPPQWQILQRAKWNAWDSNRSLSQAEAQRRYVAIVQAFLRHVVQTPTNC